MRLRMGQTSALISKTPPPHLSGGAGTEREEPELQPWAAEFRDEKLLVSGASRKTVPCYSFTSAFNRLRRMPFLRCAGRTRSATFRNTGMRYWSKSHLANCPHAAH
jgi:hypothetical protein